MELEQSTMRALFNLEEFNDFTAIVKEVCVKRPEIRGVVITGSLTQSLRLPDPLNSHFNNQFAKAYNLIERPGRRRIFSSSASDLDVWVCLKDPDNIGNVRLALETQAIALLKWLSVNLDLYSKEEWVDKKHQVFNEFYKQAYMYSETWNQLNPSYPWRGGSLKRELSQALQYHMPSLVSRINYHFDKKIPGEFIELRAYPECTFNLRPDESVIDGKEDKSPFPRIIERLLDMNRNCFVLYVSEAGQENMIYPLNVDGERLGHGILNFITEAH